MSNTFAVWNNRPAGSLPGAATSSGDQFGKQDFLNLLAAQLRNQNPMQPLDNKDFMAQTAQFHSLEQLQQMNDLLSAALGLNTLNHASSLIGKQVTAVDADNNVIEGTVTEVALQDGEPLLLVGDTVVTLDSVVIVSAATSS